MIDPIEISEDLYASYLEKGSKTLKTRKRYSFLEDDRITSDKRIICK